MRKAPLKTTVHIAVRKDLNGGREWLDTHTLSVFGRDEAQRKACEQNGQIPEWAHANPVIRIAECYVVER
jgi:hypothetical protein